MFVKEVILDGFKSYSTRTVVSGFDPSFNAITGLNGSGKSNILDAICFVLGISNLSQVRVSNLQELVYKQGQAGITKATVTIVFDNRDRKQSPVGYEQYEEITITRQIAIGGRNKYLINGQNAQQSRVQNLFHSVQLNVNNPHFLIMQGRITKVMNMKPQETLSMIEEAAGTRMYELKKIAAIKTIEKKQTKVEEINNILQQDINPTLEKLRGERSQYMKWAANETESERLHRFVIAYQYTTSEKKIGELSLFITEVNSTVDENKKFIKEYENSIRNLEVEEKQLLSQRDAKSEGEFKQAETKAENLSKELVKINASYTHKKETFETDQLANAKAIKTLSETEATLQHKQTVELPEAETKLVSAREAYATSAKSIENMQQKLQAVAAGVTSDGDSDKTLVDQLMHVKKDIAQTATDVKQCELNIQHNQSEVKEKEKRLIQAEKTSSTMVAEFKLAKEKCEKADANLTKITSKNLNNNNNNNNGGATPTDSKLKELKSTKSTKLQEISKLNEQVDALAAQLGSLDFVYSDPEKGFDRSRVKGLVANLVDVKDVKTATALEVTAGGKLFNVVVDTEETGKKLLENGNLKHRVTIIPLNKISSRTLSKDSVSAAEKEVGKEHARTALSLVGYSDSVKAAVEFVFGNSFVCTSMEEAKMVTFNKNVQARSVTLDGDVFDPAGTLTGGSRTKSTSVLLRLQELNDLRKRVFGLQKEVASLDDAIKQSENEYQLVRAAEQELSLRSHELKLIEERMERTEFHHLRLAVEEAKNTLVSLESEREKLLTKQKNLISQAKDLEDKMKNAEKYRQNQMKEAEQRMTKTKQEHSQIQKNLKEAQSRVEEIKLEIQQLAEEIRNLKSNISQSSEALKEAKTEVAKLNDAMLEKKGEYEQSQAILETLRETLKEIDRNIEAVNGRKQLVSEKLSNAGIEIKRKENEVSRLMKEMKECEGRLHGFSGQHKWISLEKKFFGKPHTDFDFTARDPQVAERRYRELQEEQSSLSKKINKKVMSMFDKAEQDYQDLISKKAMIEADKLKIENVIEELDKKKNEALKTTWKKVNRDFGSIFSTLLPGAFSRLAPPEGMTVLDGLEVKVAFGEVWKESLSELSGGQRSLLALSLILALLLFKPAPMYILDEVDAALDLSHTQNIGQMLRTHFTHSQFIVVSLKEGMFNNANVLFRTKFVDGVSTVTRIAMSESNNNNNNNINNENENSNGNGKSKNGKNNNSNALAKKQATSSKSATSFFSAAATAKKPKMVAVHANNDDDDYDDDDGIEA